MEGGQEVFTFAEYQYREVSLGRMRVREESVVAMGYRENWNGRLMDERIQI